MELRRGRDKSSLPLFLLAGFIFGFKTYIVYRFLLDIQIESLLQELIIFINPFVTSIIFFGLSIWLQKSTHQRKFILYSVLVGSVIIYFNLIFYRSFTDFLTIPQLFQTSNFADLTTSILTLVKWYDGLLFFDILIIWLLSKKATFTQYTKRKRVFAAVMSLLLISGNFLLAELERPQLLLKAFDREYLVKNIGIFYYHVYDVVINSKMHTQRVLAEGNDLNEIIEYLRDKQAGETDEALFGIAKDRNVIMISAESIQSFVINNDLYGEEITPFLNELSSDPDTFYFDQFYHQTAQGKTSDSEFLTDNSLYPISSGAVFFTHGQNEYNALPKILKKNHYQSAVFHANTGTFWNRNQMYESLGYNQFYDVSYYDVNEKNQVGWGLKDKPFFTQTIPYLSTLESPFYTKLITLTNHFPFELSEEDRTIEPFDSDSDTLNNYIPTVRYADEAIEQFFHELKLAGLYEDSIIIIMGDHDGISANHQSALAEFLNVEEISPYDQLQLQRVPLFIHIPGSHQGEVNSNIGGQIDFKPTLLHLLGIETEQSLDFGSNLFTKDKVDVTGFRNGNFVSEEYVYTNETCYDRISGEILAYNDHFGDDDPCSAMREKVELELTYSDQLIYGDLLRFVDLYTN